MPNEDDCNHPDCYGEPCKQQLTPDEAAFAFARRLIADGFIQTSRKYRTVAQPPIGCQPEDMLKPACLNSPEGEIVARYIMQIQDRFARELGVHKTLTVKQFRAFQRLKADSFAAISQGEPSSMTEPDIVHCKNCNTDHERPVTIEAKCTGKCNGRTFYAVGPIPTEPDERKSPRCGNCGGIVVQLKVVGRLAR